MYAQICQWLGLSLPRRKVSCFLALAFEPRAEVVATPSGAPHATESSVRGMHEAPCTPGHVYHITGSAHPSRHWFPHVPFGGYLPDPG